MKLSNNIFLHPIIPMRCNSHCFSFGTIAGGLLIAFPREQAAAFCREMEKSTGHTAWIIGIVDRGSRTAQIIEKPRVIAVTTKMN